MHRVKSLDINCLSPTITIDSGHLLPPSHPLIPHTPIFPSLQSRVRKLTESSEEIPELKQRLRVLEEKQQSDETRTRELEVRGGKPTVRFTVTYVILVVV